MPPMQNSPPTPMQVPAPLSPASSHHSLPQITIPNGVIHSPPSHLASPTSQPPHVTYAPQYIIEPSSMQHEKMLPRVLTPIAQAQNQYVELFIV